MIRKPAILFATAALAAVATCAAAQPQWRQALERFEKRLGELVDDLTGPGPGLSQPYGMLVPPGPDPADAAASIRGWPALAAPAPRSMVVLVHGLDEPGDIWNDLAPAIVREGHDVARFEYANDQRVHVSAAELVGALRAARAAGVEEVTVVAHSMGGLVTFDALTRADGYGGDIGGGENLPRVTRLITVGTPWTGSPWARLRRVSEVRDQVMRWLEDESWDIRPILNPDGDGVGQAGDDLAEGSALIEELASRPMPEGLPLTVLAGRIAPSLSGDLGWLENSAVLRDIFGAESLDRFTDDLTTAGGRLGDGVVPIESALARGAADTVVFETNHRGMVRRSPIDFATGTGPDGPPGIAVILDRLREDADR